MRRVLVQPGGIAKELVPTRDWHCRLSFRNWRIGACFDKSMWSFDFLWFYIWCDRYERHGEMLAQIPEGAEIVAAPNVRLSDLQAVGATVSFVPRDKG